MLNLVSQRPISNHYSILRYTLYYRTGKLFNFSLNLKLSYQLMNLYLVMDDSGVIIFKTKIECAAV
jgi:hypothetical protein